MDNSFRNTLKVVLLRMHYREFKYNKKIISENVMGHWFYFFPKGP